MRACSCRHISLNFVEHQTVESYPWLYWCLCLTRTQAPARLCGCARVLNALWPAEDKPVCPQWTLRRKVWPVTCQRLAGITQALRHSTSKELWPLATVQLTTSLISDPLSRSSVRVSSR